jgi:hypothetical protein
MCPHQVRKSGDTKDRICEKVVCVFDQFLKYHMKIVLGDFFAKVGREDIFKPTLVNESVCEISNDNGVSVVNFYHVNVTMFQNHKIHKYAWTSPDGKTQSD